MRTQCPFDIELHREIWEQGYRAAAQDLKAFRRETASSAMCAMIKVNSDDVYPDPEEVAVMAVAYADELIKELREQ